MEANKQPQDVNNLKRILQQELQKLSGNVTEEQKIKKKILEKELIVLQQSSFAPQGMISEHSKQKAVDDQLQLSAQQTHSYSIKDLRRAFILKEIFDKPLALRRR
jgi:hypothetical protein